MDKSIKKLLMIYRRTFWKRLIVSIKNQVQQNTLSKSMHVPQVLLMLKINDIEVLTK